MNKNTVVAFLLIAVTVIFFNSSLWNNFWYGRILKKPVPTYLLPQSRDAAKSPSVKDSTDIKIILPNDTKETVLSGDTLSAPPPILNSAGISSDTAVVVAQTVEDTIIVETDKLVAAITNKGARIISVKMKDYRYVVGFRKDEMIDLIPNGGTGGAQLSVNNESFDDKFFNIAVDGYNIICETKSSDGRTLQKAFTFADGTYKIGYAVRGENIVGKKITLGWDGGINDSEADESAHSSQAIGAAYMDKRRAHYSNGRSVDHFEMKKKGVEEPSGMFRWVAMSSKYFFVALVADTIFNADIKIVGRDITADNPSQKSRSKERTIDYSIYYGFEAESNDIDNWIYAGPGGIKELSKYGLKFEKYLFPVLSWVQHIFWADAWFPPLAEIILKVLLYLYGLVKDYGIAIFLLTLLSKIITYPMTQSSMKSMMKMKDLQPKLTAIRQKHKGNPQKLNEEMMALYKAEGINPFNPGCLPMFLQMPIFIALFIVLRKAIELRGASSFLLPWVKDLSLPEALFYLPGAGLPFYGNNVALMPIIMAAVTFIQQKQTIQDPNQKMMIYMMPLIMLVMFNGFPAGVVFYWTVSSALGLLQQMLTKPKTSVAVATVGAGISGAKTTTATVVKSMPSSKKRSSGGHKKRR